MQREGSNSTNPIGRRTYLKRSGALSLAVISLFSGSAHLADARQHSNTNTLDIRSATGERVFYEFTVRGTLEAKANTESSGVKHTDSVNETTATGSTSDDGIDAYRFSGAIVAIDVDGPEVIRVNEKRVSLDDLGKEKSGASSNDESRLGSNSSIPKTLTVENNGKKRAFYEFTVDERVRPGSDADFTGATHPDSIDGRTGSGSVKGGADTYRFEHRVTAFEHEGPVTVSIDGKKVDPGTLGRSKQRPSNGRPSLKKLGRVAPISGGGYADASVRSDGRFAVVGTKYGASGSLLINLSRPRNPKALHHRSASSNAPTPDVSFDSRDGLYYRTVEGAGNFEIVDYGYANGSKSSPKILASVGDGSTHNLFPHPEKPLLYTVNYDYSTGTRGLDVYDVSNPRTPEKLREFGVQGACHDLVVDPDRDLLHAAYMGAQFDGYVVYDASNPRSPRERGRFDYGNAPSYDGRAIGKEAFGFGHHVKYDPRRAIAVVGDERSFGEPGGKHVFDIGWGKGSPENPIPIGFTLSPNARRMKSDPDGDGTKERRKRWEWTGHDFDFVPWGDSTYLVSGDYHEGCVVYDLTDPRDPAPIDRYRTTDGPTNPNADLARYGSPPQAWTARYNSARDLVVASDQFTGVYTFSL